VVKIRYAELPAGLHVRAEVRGRDTIVYLQPGLTTEQRRAALARVRNSGRMGHGPPLSAAGMARAAGADKLRATARNGLAAMRGHPLLLLPPLILLVSGAIVFVLMSFVTVTVREHERTIAQPPGLAVTPGHTSAYHRGSGSGPPAVPPAAGPGTSAPGRGPWELAPSPGTAQSPSPSPSPATPVPVLTSAPSSASPVPTVSPSPQPSADPTQTDTCVRLGPLGLCLTL
jgi:hypothetical protein